MSKVMPKVMPQVMPQVMPKVMPVGGAISDRHCLWYSLSVAWLLWLLNNWATFKRPLDLTFFWY
jgi:hypothetical protein